MKTKTIVIFTQEDYDNLKRYKEKIGDSSGCFAVECGEVHCSICPLNGLSIDERLEYVKNHLED